MLIQRLVFLLVVLCKIVLFLIQRVQMALLLVACTNESKSFTRSKFDTQKKILNHIFFCIIIETVLTQKNMFDSCGCRAKMDTLMKVISVRGQKKRELLVCEDGRKESGTRARREAKERWGKKAGSYRVSKIASGMQSV